MLERVRSIPPVTTVLLALVIIGLTVRIAVLALDLKPDYLAGLTAWQSEMARNIVDHGRWFVVNPEALGRLQLRQDEAGKLLSPSRSDFSGIDQKAREEPEILEMPGLALVDAGVWSATGDKAYAPIKWIQIVLDLVMVVLIFWIGVKLTRNHRIGLLAAGGYAFWPGAVILAKTPSLDTWAEFFAVGALALFLWAREGRYRYARLAIFGLLIGVAIYFRPFLILLAPVLPLIGLASRPRQRVAEALVPTLIALIVIAPWTIRNAYEFGKFIPTRTGLGQALWMGLGEKPNDFGAVNSDVATAKWVHRRNPKLREGTPEFDDFLLHRAVSAIRDEPLHYLELIARRSLYLLPCGLALLWRRRWPRERLILVGVALSVILPYVFLRIEDRFWLPASFAYFLLAAIIVECALRVRVPESAATASRT